MVWIEAGHGSPLPTSRPYRVHLPLLPDLLSASASFPDRG